MDKRIEVANRLLVLSREIERGRCIQPSVLLALRGVFSDYEIERIFSVRMLATVCDEASDDVRECLEACQSYLLRPDDESLQLSWSG